MSHPSFGHPLLGRHAALGALGALSGTPRQRLGRGDPGRLHQGRLSIL